MKHVTNQRKRKRWLAPLALCLALCLAIHPVGLNIVQAEENVEEDAVGAYWNAQGAFWNEEEAFWPAIEQFDDAKKAYDEAMTAYDEAEDGDRNTTAIDAARPEVLRSIEEFYEAYDAVTAAFNDVTAKFNALSDEEKAAKDENNPQVKSPQEVYDEISEFYNGDDPDDIGGIKGSYIDVEDWNYWDNAFQHYNAITHYYSAYNALWGEYDDNGNIVTPGATQEYEETINNGGDVDTALEKVQESISDLKYKKESIDKFYAAMKKAYEKIPENKRTDYTNSFGTETTNKENVDDNYQESLSSLNIWEYSFSNADFGKAWELFCEAANNFSGNELENIAGVYPTYIAALESETEDLDALYEEVLAARDAVEEAYNTLTEKYQAENVAYEKLTDDDKQAAAEMHKDIKESYTGYGTETYSLVCGSEIPAPPQKEEPVPTPTPVPTTPPQEDPVATPTPAPTTPPQEDPVATPTPAPTTPPQEDPVATPTPAPTTPPQEDPVATPTPAPTTPPQEDPVATPTPAPTTPPQDVPVATPTPAPAKPSGQGSAAQSAPAQEPLADWNVVYKDVDNSVASGEAQNVYAQAGTQFQVNSNILDKLAGSKTALFLNTGTGLSFSISGVDVPQGVPSLKVAMATADGIPETAKQSVLTGAAFSRTFAMEDKSVYPVKIDVHLNVGKENAGKNAYLYYYDETTGNLKLAGAFRATEAGQAMFAINRGDEYIVVVADNAAAAMQLGRYTVVPGDSLSRIAAKNGMSLKQLLKVNPGIKNPNKIHPGDVINLD